MSAGNVGDSSLALEALIRGNQVSCCMNQSFLGFPKLPFLFSLTYTIVILIYYGIDSNGRGFVAVTSRFVYWSVLPISWPPTTEEW